MNVCFVNATRKWGGVKTWTLDLACWMQQHGHAAHIIARPGPFADKCSESSLPVWQLEFGFDFHPVQIHKFQRYFREHNMDLVVANVGKDMRIAGVAAKLMGIPVVHRVGLPGDMRNMFKVRGLHKWIRPAILVPSEDTKSGLLRNLPYLDATEVTAIHTGKQVAPEPTTAPDGPLRLITTSQLNPDKGHADLLDTLAAIAHAADTATMPADTGGFAANKSWTLDILATGSQAEPLEQQVKNLGLEDNVTFHGFQKDVRPFLRNADVFILPSYSEGLPNALLEGMANGLVPVARPVGGVPEVWPTSLPQLLAESADNGSLHTPLEHIFKATTTELQGWKATTLAHCAAHLNMDTQAARIVKWFRTIIEKG